MNTSRLLFAYLLGNVNKADIRLALKGDRRTRVEALQRLQDGVEHTVLDDALSRLDDLPPGDVPWVNAFPIPRESVPIVSVTHQSATQSAETYESAPKPAAPDANAIAELRAGQEKLTQTLAALLEHLKGK